VPVTWSQSETIVKRVFCSGCPIRKTVLGQAYPRTAEPPLVTRHPMLVAHAFCYLNLLITLMYYYCFHGDEGGGQGFIAILNIS
jgi:hypothetical protein